MKAQATIFIIIGIVILLIIGITIYITSTTEIGQLELVRQQAQQAPLETLPIRDIIQTCLTTTTTNALQLIGNTGGYTKPLPANPAQPTEAEAIALSPKGQPIAYWWHMKSPNTCKQNCQFETKRPPLTGPNSIEQQIEQYVNNNIENCAGLANYNTNGCSATATNKPTTDTTIIDGQIITTLDYPLRLTCPRQTYDTNTFAITTNLDLKQIYELATEITNMQIQNQILEQATTNILYTYSGTNSDKLPPIREIDFTSPKSTPYWIKYTVEQQIKSLLTSNIPIIQLSGARNYDYIQAPRTTFDPELYELAYNRDFLIPTNKTYPQLETHFTYLDWWQPYIDLSCQGQICKPAQATNFFILPFQLNRYEFTYDISYPVLVEIRDPIALDGYSFKFALEQNLRNNQPFTAGEYQLNLPETTTSNYCDPEQKTSQDLTINVRDTEGKPQIATITYTCGQNACTIGDTENGMLTTKLPACIGGTIKVTKDDYATTTIPFDSDETNTILATIQPIKEIPVTIRNFLLTKPSKKAQWELQEGGTTTPQPYQETTIQLKRIGETYEEPYFTLVQLNGNQPQPLKITPGKYETTIISLYKTNITIPPDTRCINVPKIRLGVPVGKDKKCFQLPTEPITFDSTTPYPAGTATFQIEITPEMMNAQLLQFKTYVQAIDKLNQSERIIEDLEQITTIETYAISNEAKLQPVIV